jgi:hypothetical protein
MNDAQKLVDLARQSAGKALVELESVTQRVFREMDRFKRTVDTELRILYANFARVEVENSGQLDAEWKKLSFGSVGDGSAAITNSNDSKTTVVPASPSDDAEVLMI